MKKAETWSQTFEFLFAFDKKKNVFNLGNFWSDFFLKRLLSESSSFKNADLLIRSSIN